MDKSPKKSFWSVTPATVRYDDKLPFGARLLYGEISALCNERGYCWASNQYFAHLYRKDLRTVSRWIGTLSDRGHILLKVAGKERKIFLAKHFDISDAPDDMDEMTGEQVEASPGKTERVKVQAKPREKKYTDEDMRLAELLFQKIIYNFPAFENKKVQLAEWADDIRKLREIDKASPDQILFMITWVHGGEIVKAGQPTRQFAPHDFWARNIMSAKKLRKQWFDNLVPQLQQAFQKAVKKTAVADLSGNGNGVPMPQKTHAVAQL